MNHELKYMPSVQGFEHLGIPNNDRPHWYCTCGTWRKYRDSAGRPFAETARKRHREHVREAT